MTCHIPELNGIFLLVNLTFFVYSLYCHSIAFESLKVFIIQDPAKGTTSFLELFVVCHFLLFTTWVALSTTHKCVPFKIVMITVKTMMGGRKHSLNANNTVIKLMIKQEWDTQPNDNCAHGDTDRVNQIMRRKMRTDGILWFFCKKIIFHFTFAHHHEHGSAEFYLMKTES